jgi:hypothetical protein
MGRISKAIARLESWKLDRGYYFDDVRRTLIQTGDVFVCESDVFALCQHLRQLNISPNDLSMRFNYGGCWVHLDTFKKDKLIKNSKTPKSGKQ